MQDIIEIGEGVERNARAGAARATPGEQRTARSGANGAHDSEGRFMAATAVHTTPREESAEASAWFARTSIEFGGGMTLDFSTAAPNGGGFFVSATHDVLRWQPARWSAITFASVGGGVHGAFSALSQTYSFHADIGMRVRLGSAHGSSFSVSGHYTPGALLGVIPATQSTAAQAEGSAMYLGYRVDAALHFNSYFAMSVRYTDQYRPAMINGLRMVSLGLAWTF